MVAVRACVRVCDWVGSGSWGKSWLETLGDELLLAG